MSNPTREDLLGYLLGALERTEHERVDRQLEENPQLQKELAVLRRWVEGMGLADEPVPLDPPPGLAARTCQLVELRQSPDVSISAPVLKSTSAFEKRSHFSLADMVAAAAVMIAAASLFFPALASSRFQADIAVCQNHLRQVGFAAQDYSGLQPDRSFPAVQPVGNRAAAGVYAPILAEGKFVTDPRLFVCPASDLAQQMNGWEIPTLSQLDNATGATLEKFKRTMGGSYGYSLGYLRDGKLAPPVNEHRTHYALLADAPSDANPERRTENHGGKGQNVLYEDGHVSFLTSLPKSDVADDPFHNHDGEVAAGVHRNDAVIGRSSDPPMPFDWISEGNR